MKHKTPFIILAIVIVILAVAILAPGGRQADKNPKLPWQITILEDGSARVFELTLGKSPLSQAAQLLSKSPVLSLFRSPSGEFSIEAYFQRVALSGLRADFILTLEIDQTIAAEIFARGLRISQLGSGSKKVNLAETDVNLAMSSAIRHIAYLPATDLDAALIERYFGKPQRIIDVPEGGAHWLYPEKGLDIILNEDADEVFQYVQPKHFNQLLEPLLNSASAPEK
ncbi:MAG: hypothetical protein ACI9W6_002891 [Motiliproteus sp.]|jgi:hypothetical protein